MAHIKSVNMIHRQHISNHGYTGIISKHSFLIRKNISNKINFSVLKSCDSRNNLWNYCHFYSLKRCRFSPIFVKSFKYNWLIRLKWNNLIRCCSNGRQRCCIKSNTFAIFLWTDTYIRVRQQTLNQRLIIICISSYGEFIHCFKLLKVCKQIRMYCCIIRTLIVDYSIHRITYILRIHYSSIMKLNSFTKLKLPSQLINLFPALCKSRKICRFICTGISHNQCIINIVIYLNSRIWYFCVSIQCCRQRLYCYL